MIELPHIFIQTIIYGLLVYSMIGFEWTVTKFFWFIFFMYFTFLYFTFYGMMAIAITPNQHISSIVSTAFYGLWNLFSGFIIPHTVSMNFNSRKLHIISYMGWGKFLILYKYLWILTRGNYISYVILDEKSS